MSDQSNGSDQSGMGETPAQSDEDRFTDNLLAAASGIAEADEGEASPVEDQADDGDQQDGDEPGTDEGEQPEADDQPVADKDDVAAPDEGRLLMADYTRKTQALSEERRQFTQEREEFTTYKQGVEASLSKVFEFVQGLIPPAPHPQLAQTDPGRYVAEHANRQAAMAELQALVEAKGEVDQHQQGFDAAQAQRNGDAEVAALVKAMPELRDPAKMAKFQGDVVSAAKSAGFTDADVGSIMDHRMLVVLQRAAIGERALTNRQNYERRKAEAPKQGREGRAAPPPDPRNRALEELRRTGSDKAAARYLAMREQPPS